MRGRPPQPGHCYGTHKALLRLPSSAQSRGSLLAAVALNKPSCEGWSRAALASRRSVASSWISRNFLLCHGQVLYHSSQKVPLSTTTASPSPALPRSAVAAGVASLDAAACPASSADSGIAASGHSIARDAQMNFVESGGNTKCCDDIVVHADFKVAAPIYRSRKLVNVVNRVKKDDILHGLVVTGLDWEGNGIVHLRVREMKKTFLFRFPRTLPGERVTLRVDKFEKHRRGVDSKCTVMLLGTTQPSTHERPSLCRHFNESCGGCALLHFAYGAQLLEKQQLLLAAMKKHYLPPQQEQRDIVLPVIPSEKELSFRNTSEFVFLQKGGPRLGHYHFDSPAVTDVMQCPKLTDAARRVYKALRQQLLPAFEVGALSIFNRLTGQGLLASILLRCAVDSNGRDRVLLSITCQRTHTLPAALKEVCDAVIAKGSPCADDIAGIVVNSMKSPGKPHGNEGDEVVLHGDSFITQAIGGFQFKITSRSSFPTNATLLSPLYQTIRRLAAVEPHHIVYDFFAGCGLMTVFLAPHCKHVFAFDSYQQNIKEIEDNLSLNNIGNASAFFADLSHSCTFYAITQKLPSCHKSRPVAENFKEKEGEAEMSAGVALDEGARLYSEWGCPPTLVDSGIIKNKEKQRLDKLAIEALTLHAQRNNGDKRDLESKSIFEKNSAYATNQSLRDADATCALDSSKSAFMTSANFAEDDTESKKIANTGCQFAGLSPPNLFIIQASRLGCDKAMRRWLRTIVVPRIIFVSRHPPTMLRDIAPLAYLGYKLECIQPMDMFPHTANLMCVALLTSHSGAQP